MSKNSKNGRLKIRIPLTVKTNARAVWGSPRP